MLLNNLKRKTMKKLLILVVASLLTLVACKEESGRLIDFNTLGKGAYPRLLSGGNTIFDINNPSSGKITWEVELVDLERGKLVKEMRVFVSLKDNSAGNGDGSKAEKLWQTKGQSDFTDSKDKYRSTSFSVTYADLNSFLGTDVASHYSGDQFRFRSELEMTDGRVFSSANSNTPVLDPAAFFSLFDPVATLQCLYDASKFLGLYNLEYLDTTFAAFGPTFGATPPQVELKTVSGSATRRQFEITYIPDNTNVRSKMNFVFDLVCDQIVVGTINTNYGCAAGTTVTLGPSTGTTFDRNNDSSLTIYYREFARSGGCPGVTPTAIGIKLTKKG